MEIDNSINKKNENFLRDVWAHNLYEEFADMLKVAENYPIIAMDTEFPGTVVDIPFNPDIKQPSYLEYKYVVSNVNLLKLIQIGFSFFDKKGKHAKGPCTWQFNFKFNINYDMGGSESLKLLEGLNFEFSKNSTEGIEHITFAELFYSSNLIMNPNITWVTFHGSSDFCYLTKMLLNTHLAHNEEKFYPYLNCFFPRVYDLKVILQSSYTVPTSLKGVCEYFNIDIEGTAHHAGSDSLVTGKAFFVAVERLFEGCLDDVRYLGRVIGFNFNDASESINKYIGESKKEKIFRIEK